MASELGSAATPPQPRLVSLVVHIKLNGFANAAFRFTPSCLATLLPAPSTPATHFAFRPKLIGLRIDRLELFILCLAINQFLRRPNRGRKDRTASDETEEDVVYSSNKERSARVEQTKEDEQQGTRTRVWWLGGQLTLLERSSNELRRRLISSFDPMTRKIRPRKKIDDFAPRYTVLPASQSAREYDRYLSRSFYSSPMSSCGILYLFLSYTLTWYFNL